MEDSSNESRSIKYVLQRCCKALLKTYNSNKWVGKVIPGKVKATYEGEVQRMRYA